MKNKNYHFKVVNIEVENNGLGKECTLKLTCLRGKKREQWHYVYLHFSHWFVPYFIKKIFELILQVENEITSIKASVRNIVGNKEV